MDYLGWLFFLATILPIFILIKKVNSFESSVNALSDCRDFFRKSEEDKVELVRSHQKIKDQLDYLNNFHSAEQSNSKKIIEKLEQDLYDKEQSRKTTLSQKSSEVRIGNIAEKLAPFLEDFPYNPEDAIFAGKPIDYIVFDEKAIVFVEIKSGKSQLSKSKGISEI